MDLFFHEARHRIDDEDTLSKIDALLDWGAFLPVLKRGLKRSNLGPIGYDPLILFKCMLLGQWHGLSDPKLEKALKVRLDFMLFCGLGLHDTVPDETTHCRFRNALASSGVYDDLLTLVCQQIERHGLKLKEGQAVMIDATLIESAARPNKFLDTNKTPHDREEVTDAPDTNVSFSADPDATWIKKGRKSVLGYKGFARCDDEGFIEKVHTTPANKGESPEFETMVAGSKAKRVLADKAYASAKNRDLLKGKYRDGILHKAVRGCPLRPSQKRFNKLISKQRFRIEQCFGTMKRLFHLSRARYFGQSKVHAQITMAAIGQNLLKAANKITLIKQTSPIA